MLRDLLARPQGKIPEGLVYRLWREMISTFTLEEGRLSVAVSAAADQDLWDLARDYYGFATPLAAVAGPKAALERVVKGKDSIAVLPWPAAKDQAWWPWLARYPDLRIFARLPFLEHPTNGRGKVKSALAVARLDPEPTRDDRGFLIAETAADMTKMKLKKLFEAAGIVPVTMFESLLRATKYFLVEIQGLGHTDLSAKLCAEHCGVYRLLGVGGYAVPMTRGKKGS